MTSGFTVEKFKIIWTDLRKRIVLNHKRDRGKILKIARNY